MLKQHAFYVYHSENRVMARRGSEAPVVARECKGAQEAHDLVQSIVNPRGAPADAFGRKGYNSDEFQAAIAGNCQSFVEAAYAARAA